MSSALQKFSAAVLCSTLDPPLQRCHTRATQGDEDEIVPPEQSELMWQAIKAKGLPTTLMMYKVGASRCIATAGLTSQGSGWRALGVSVWTCR